jgi:hypothetical protein
MMLAVNPIECLRNTIAVRNGTIAPKPVPVFALVFVTAWPQEGVSIFAPCPFAAVMATETPTRSYIPSTALHLARVGAISVSSITAFEPA